VQYDINITYIGHNISTFGVYHNMLHVVVVSYVITFDVILKVMCHAHMKFESYFENN